MKFNYAIETLEKQKIRLELQDYDTKNIYYEDQYAKYRTDNTKEIAELEQAIKLLKKVK